VCHPCHASSKAFGSRLSRQDLLEVRKLEALVLAAPCRLSAIGPLSIVGLEADLETSQLGRFLRIPRRRRDERELEQHELAA